MNLNNQLALQIPFIDAENDNNIINDSAHDITINRGTNMPQKITYKTKQREELITYLEDTKGEHITAIDVCDYFHGMGNPIGTSTVYRQLERLVDEGLLAKYILEPGSPACFEYLGAEHAEGTAPCFHCKCEICGKLIHMHCEELEQIAGHLLADHGFLVNPLRTVFYGVCDACREEA